MKNYTNMKNYTKFVLGSSIVSVLLFSGCVDQNTLNSPTTQTAAAVGAVTGAVIGGNVGDRSGTNIALGTVAGAIAGGAIGQTIENQNPQPVQDTGWQ